MMLHEDDEDVDVHEAADGARRPQTGAERPQTGAERRSSHLFNKAKSTHSRR